MSSVEMKIVEFDIVPYIRKTCFSNRVYSYHHHNCLLVFINVN